MAEESNYDELPFINQSRVVGMPVCIAGARGFELDLETCGGFGVEDAAQVLGADVQVWNGSEFGRSFGVSDTTVRRYLDTMSAALVVRPLQPWHANLSKRQVKSPQVYIRNSGLLHALLGIENRTDLERHPKVGASWEGFLLERVVVVHAGDETFPLAKRVRAVAAGRILDNL